MFGELDDSNIYESFDAFSNENGPEDDASDFSFGDDSDTNAGAQGNDDFLDMSSYSDRMGQQPQTQQRAQQQVPPPQNYGAAFDDVPPMDDAQIPTDEEIAAYQQAQQQQQQAPAQNKKGGGGVFFLIVLVLLAAAAGGLFYYKNYMQPSGAPADQASGDYFYDQAQEQGAAAPQGETAQAPDAQQNPDGSVATVDVDLNTASAPAEQEQAAGTQNTDKVAQNTQDGKELSPLEKAQQKEKQDAQKEGKFSNRVIIPVVAGGRVDPFVPYMQKVAESSAPKFDLIAPPSTVPMADPVVDEIVQTKISGIMFDAARPSAIINIGGTDQLVHKGDVVNGFSVLDITKKTVTLKYGSNIYQASVGESVNEGINLNPVSNLNRSFGGAYSKTPNNAIHF